MLKKILLLSFLTLGTLSAQADFMTAEEAFKNHRYSEAFRGFLPEADKGDFRSQYYVGYMYLYGLGVTKNEEKALQYIQSSANQDYDTAQALLGFLYDEGRLVPLDKKKAISYYKKAADRGNTSALLNLGLAYYKGEGVAKNDQTAIEMLEKVPLDEQPLAGRYLGEIYLSNTAFSDRYQKAANAYSSSAKNGDIGSYYALGQIYSRDDSGMADKDRALNFYTYAASEGFVPAQYWLGTMYVNGEGVVRNLYLGHAWLEMAAGNRYEPDISALSQLDSDMTLSEIEASKKEFMRLQQEVLGKMESPFVVEERIRAEQAEAEPVETGRYRRRRR